MSIPFSVSSESSIVATSYNAITLSGYNEKKRNLFWNNSLLLYSHNFFILWHVRRGYLVMIVVFHTRVVVVFLLDNELAWQPQYELTYIRALGG